MFGRAKTYATYADVRASRHRDRRDRRIVIGWIAIVIA
jgi:hypothetical protein